MVKKRMFIIFCMIGSLVSEGICRNTARRTGRHTDQTANKRQVVVQLDMPDHEDVPEICLYLNGNQKISDNTGMNRFPAPDKIPSKWYYLITRHFNPTASQVNNVTTFSIAADKAHRLFSCKWNDELKEWIIKEKTEASLAKRSYNLKHPKETIIVNMHPRYLDSIQSPRITSETSNNNVFFTLPIIQLRNDEEKPFNKRQSAKSILYNRTEAGTFHTRLKETSSNQSDGKTAVRTLQINRS